jgi:Transposase, Mutator family
LDQLLAGADAKTAFYNNGLIDRLTKALAERVLNAEMDHHLAGDGGAGNSRNGYGKETVLTDTGKIDLEIARDRQSTFDPQLIAKYQRRFPGFDEKIISMYARGRSSLCARKAGIMTSAPAKKSLVSVNSPIFARRAFRSIGGVSGSGRVSAPNTPATPSRSCDFHVVIWLAWTSYC